MYVLVTGGRNYRDYTAVSYALAQLYDQLIIENEPFRCPDFVVVHGAARGADSLAARWVKAMQDAGYENVYEEPFPADWKRYGKAAGPIRNKQMLTEARPDLVLAFPGGRGTADMVRQARQAGVEVQYGVS